MNKTILVIDDDENIYILQRPKPRNPLLKTCSILALFSWFSCKKLIQKKIPIYRDVRILSSKGKTQNFIFERPTLLKSRCHVYYFSQKCFLHSFCTSTFVIPMSCKFMPFILASSFRPLILLSQILTLSKTYIMDFLKAFSLLLTVKSFLFFNRLSNCCIFFNSEAFSIKTSIHRERYF